MATIDRLHEVILYVEDIERMATFYETSFELTVAEGSRKHGFLRYDTGEASLCLHDGGSAEAVPGAPKVVFAVADLETARSSLERAGVEMGPIRSPTPTVRVCDGLDPEGNVFSIEEP